MHVRLFDIFYRYSEAVAREQQIKECWDSDAAIHRLFQDIFSEADDEKRKVSILAQYYRDVTPA